MLYCPKCSRLTRSEVCPSCEGSKRLREPSGDDPVLLLATRFVHASMIEPLLEEAKIPYSKIDQMGWGATLGFGTMLESYQFYVPYAAYPEALELVAGIFANDEEVMRGLGEAVGQ
ncbi:MAG: hypothetical protein GX647_10170 [Clostridiales bacterium]|jgi:hypothetical protein|nr:hypothetical protein [Clostridiales bacterium]OPZ67042.1 MAG: hypothetical protein BWY81_01517 [Firmicutes bacterium ADurb.Bin467]